MNNSNLLALCLVLIFASWSNGQTARVLPKPDFTAQPSVSKKTPIAIAPPTAPNSIVKRVPDFALESGSPPREIPKELQSLFVSDFGTIFASGSCSFNTENSSTRKRPAYVANVFQRQDQVRPKYVRTRSGNQTPRIRPAST